MKKIILSLFVIPLFAFADYGFRNSIPVFQGLNGCEVTMRTYDFPTGGTSVVLNPCGNLLADNNQFTVSVDGSNNAEIRVNGFMGFWTHNTFDLGSLTRAPRDIYAGRDALITRNADVTGDILARDDLTFSKSGATVLGTNPWSIGAVGTGNLTQVSMNDLLTVGKFDGTTGFQNYRTISTVTLTAGTTNGLIFDEATQGVSVVGLLEARCTVNTTDNTEHATYIVRAAFQQTAGVQSMIGTSDPEFTREDDAAWDMYWAIDSNVIKLFADADATKNTEYKCMVLENKTTK